MNIPKENIIFADIKDQRTMFIEFDKEYLRELFEEGRTSDKKHRYQPEAIRGYLNVSCS